MSLSFKVFDLIMHSTVDRKIFVAKICAQLYKAIKIISKLERPAKQRHSTATFHKFLNYLSTPKFPCSSYIALGMSGCACFDDEGCELELVGVENAVRSF